MTMKHNSTLSALRKSRYMERRHTLPKYQPTKNDRGIGTVWYVCLGACGNYIPGSLYVKWHRLCVPCQRRRGLNYAAEA